MFKKNMFFAIYVLLILVVLSGCSNSSSDQVAGILMVNDKTYHANGNITDNDNTLGEKIGEVQKKVESEVAPIENFSSNLFEVGEEIYSTVEDTRVIIVKGKDGNLTKMTEVSQQNE